MVVIGEHVPEVYDEVMSQLGRGEGSKTSDTKPKKKKSLIDAFLGVIIGRDGTYLKFIMCVWYHQRFISCFRNGWFSY